MKKALALLVIGISAAGVFPVAAAGRSETAKSGEALFKEHCALCHVDGGNIVNPQKSLRRKDLAKNNIRTAEDIIKTMRNPGPGMTKFDDKIVPPKDAKEIAEYILKTFNK